LDAAVGGDDVTPTKPTTKPKKKPRRPVSDPPRPAFWDRVVVKGGQG
jgi:hypothetical protein